jgi:hypothetical protein
MNETAASCGPRRAMRTAGCRGTRCGAMVHKLQRRGTHRHRSNRGGRLARSVDVRCMHATHAPVRERRRQRVQRVQALAHAQQQGQRLLLRKEAAAARYDGRAPAPWGGCDFQSVGEAAVRVEGEEQIRALRPGASRLLDKGVVEQWRDAGPAGRRAVHVDLRARRRPLLAALAQQLLHSVQPAAARLARQVDKRVAALREQSQLR